MARRVRKSKPTDQATQIATMLQGTVASAAAANQQSAIRSPQSMQRHFSADEFIEWSQDVCYQDVKGLSWQPLRWSTRQKKGIRKMLRLRDDGQLFYRTIMPCWVRRFGKSTFSGLYDLRRADKYDDQVIVIQANSSDQGEDTVFKTIVDTIRNSPKVAAREQAGEIVILAGLIQFTRTGSIIKVQPAAEGSTYGQKIHVYHNTELCKAASDKLYQVGASSTGDAWCGLAIIDSNMGDKANAVAQYIDLAEQAEAEALAAERETRPVNVDIGDASIGADYIFFTGLDDVLTRGCGVGLEGGEEPLHPWLDADWIRSRYKQMTRSEFLRNHCNLPSGAGEVLWTDEQIEPLFRPGLDMFLAGVSLAAATRAIGGNGQWAIGVGLDRASAFSKLPDRSVVPVVGKTIIKALVGKPIDVFDEKGNVIGQEVTDGSIYVLLGAWEFMRHLRDPIQDKLLQIDRQWGIGGLALETFQASDLGEWCKGQRFGDRTSIEHMTSQAKQQLVQFMHGLIITRRFIVPIQYSVLRSELTNYREDASGGGIPSYGGKRKTVDLESFNPINGASLGKRTTWVKDDYLEAVMWAIYAARTARLAGNRAAVVAKPACL